MKYDFDRICSRQNTNCTKWDAVKTIFGSEDVIPMWVADMDFPAARPIVEALEIRAGDVATAELIETLDDPVSRMTITAERTVLARLEGGCQIPIGAYGQIQEGQLTLHGMIASLEGDKLLKAQSAGPMEKPGELGEKVAQELIDKGGREILDQIKQNP